ncbi:MAG: hypothetical protein M1828_001070 [Chrysothrix sp. TS-e1954]|nr:MAG: hypothetical protein M1828_001070 [Chrysothrix sp. TS-e1954]
MFSAYGRIGKRRHELLGTLTKVAIDEDGQALGSSAHSDRDPEMHPNPRSASGFITKSLSNLKVHPNTAEQLPTMSSALLAVLKSHVQHKPSNLYLKSVTLKVIKLEVPPTNIWERPMPQKRVKNIVHEWYGKMLRRVLPPLPEREWRELEAKASGQLKYPILSRRLNGAVSLRYRRQAPALERALTVGRERRQLEKDHTITQRFMQRVCQAVFETTPVVMWNEERKKWSVRWGYRPLNFAPKEHTSLSQALQGIGDTVSCEKGGMNSKIT